MISPEPTISIRPRQHPFDGSKRRLVMPLLLSLVLAGTTCGQLRIVSYNTANNGNSPTNTNPRAEMDVVLEAIGNDVVNGISRPLDVLSLQEQNSSSTTTAQLVGILNGIYGAGTYARATVDANTFGGGRPGLIYNTDTIELIGQVPFSTTSPIGAARQPMRYQLRPVGYDPSADFYVYVNHYKASTGATNQSRRNVEAIATRANADALGEGIHAIYSGDFNIRSSNESMYQTLLSAGPGQAFDPINMPGVWNNSSSLRITHTQSPYNPNNGDPDLIGGGMDDRFDFQLVTGEFLDNEGLSYISGSYRAFGNNGTHSVNDFINDPSNNAQPINVLNALSSVSDHLPVVVDYQLPAKMQVTVGAVPAEVLAGASIQIPVTIVNSANVLTLNAADELDYGLTTSGALTGSFNGTDQPLGGGDLQMLGFDTSLPGINSGTVNVNATSQQTAGANFSEDIEVIVLESANASFDGASNVDSIVLDFGIVVPGSTATLSFEVHNLDDGFFKAGLDLDSVLEFGDTAAFSTDLATFVDLDPGSSVAFEATMDTSEAGLFAEINLLSLSDEDLPGTPQTEQINLQLTGGVALPGDADLDGDVDTDDFDVWNNNRFTNGASWTTGDFNFDSVVDLTDLNIWNENKFTSLQDLLSVPEPSTALLALGLWGFLAIFRRRAKISG